MRRSGSFLESGHRVGAEPSTITRGEWLLSIGRTRDGNQARFQCSSRFEVARAPTGTLVSDPESARSTILASPFLCGIVAQKLGPVFKVHRVEMHPAAAPDETVPLEDGYDIGRDDGYRSTSPAAWCHSQQSDKVADIDRRAPAVHAGLAGVGNVPTNIAAERA